MRAIAAKTILFAAVAIFLALAADPALARKGGQLPAAGSLIADLLAPQTGGAVCFTGSFQGLKVNGWDYSLAKAVPVPGLFRFGKQVLRPQPFVHVDQQLTRMTLLFWRDDRELDPATHDFDQMHNFRLRISLTGWPAPLNAAGECELRLTDKPMVDSPHVDKANTTTLHCGIDCDGGSMSVERLPGTREVMFRFAPDAGGLRMSGGCSAGWYHVGGNAKPYEANLRGKPVKFRLAPMPEPECAAFRKETDHRD